MRRFVSTWDIVLIVAILLVVTIGGAAIEGVGTDRFWRFVVLEMIPIALIALPMTLVVITGEIDLSVASVLGFTCTVVGKCYAAGITSVPVLILISLALGAVLGAVNGVFITVFGLPSLAALP